MAVFHNILVYAETADADSLARVIELAERHGTAVSVCDVVDPGAADAAADSTAARLRDLAWTLALERLRVLCAPFSARVPLDYAVLTGSPFLAVTEQVVRQHFDLVVHISSGAHEGPAINSTGMHLVRKCPAAVWLLHPRERGSDGVLLAVDRDSAAAGDDDSGPALDLAAVACTLARDRGATLHLAHAWRPYGEALLEHPRAALAPPAIDRYLRAQQAASEAWFTRLADRVSAVSDGVIVARHLLRGTPAAVISKLARSTAASLVVMGTVGSGAAPGVLIGTTAEAVLTSIDTPVLALKPRGFISPLQFTAPPAPSHR